MTNLYQNHQIIRRSPDRIYFADPKDCNLWAEIVAGARGTLIFHGDGPDLILRSYRDSYTLEDLVRWVASNNVGYLATKVVAGEARVYSAEQARKDIEARIQELREDEEEARAKALESWLDDTDFEFEVPMRLSLQASFDDAWEWNIGTVISEELIFLRNACIRCAELLAMA